MRLAGVRRGRGFILLAVSAVLFTTISAAAAPGDLDPTFDGDGRVTTHFVYTDEAHGVAIQGDGKIVAAGVAICDQCAGPVTPHDFALARYNRDGSLDVTFDGDGKVTTDFGLKEDQVFAVAIQADGKIIAVGSANGPSTLDFALVATPTRLAEWPSRGTGRSWPRVRPSSPEPMTSLWRDTRCAGCRRGGRRSPADSYAVSAGTA